MKISKKNGEIKISKQNGNIGFIAIPIGIVLLLLLFGWLLSALFAGVTYHNLTKEGYVATLWFKTTKSDIKYTVEYSFDKIPTKYHEGDIYGDQWRMDAQFEKRPYLLAAIFGLDPKYAVSRIEGRYSNDTDEDTKKHLALIVNREGDLKNFSIFGWTPFVDVSYGSSVYDKINTNKVYTIFYTPTGLMVRTSDMPKALKEKKGILKEITDFF